MIFLKSPRRATTLILLALWPSITWAHEHGLAEFKLNREEKEWQAQLTIPNPDLFGFEYCAPDKAVRRHYQKVKELLNATNKMFETEPKSCSIRQYRVESPLLEQNCQTKEGAHNDAHISFVIRCGEGRDLKVLDLRFLKQFGDIKEVKLSVSTPTYSQNGSANPTASEIEVP